MLYKKHQRKSPLLGLRHRLLQHCSIRASTRYIRLILFIICLDNVLRNSFDIMKDKGFKQANKRSIRYPVQAITDAVYADDVANLANTHTQAETPERVNAGIGLHINPDKTEYMCFNKKKRRHLHT